MMLDRLVERLDPVPGWTLETLSDHETARIEDEVMRFLRTLTGYASALRSER